MILAVLITVATLAGTPGTQLCVPVTVDSPVAGLQFVVVHGLEEFGQVEAGQALTSHLFLANGERVAIAGLEEITGEVARICVGQTTNLVLTEVVASTGLGQPLPVQLQPGRAVLRVAPRLRVVK
jgi:hypothetical protein